MKNAQDLILLGFLFYNSQASSLTIQRACQGNWQLTLLESFNVSLGQWLTESSTVHAFHANHFEVNLII